MRLWHEVLLPLLPRQQLLGQHRECCALRGRGWGKPHSTVNYVFKHPFMLLVQYHYKVMQEMLNRGYHPDSAWFDSTYRGKNCEPYVYPKIEVHTTSEYQSFVHPCGERITHKFVYPEHNDQYIKECLDNLERKGIHIEPDTI